MDIAGEARAVVLSPHGAGWLVCLTLLWACTVTSVRADLAPLEDVRSGDGYVRAAALADGGREWTFGTAMTERTVSLRGGALLLTSLVNKCSGQPRECINGSGSAAFAASIDGKAVTSSDGGWVCLDSSVEKLDQGQLRLEIVLEKALLRVTKHYLLYPGTGIVREWTSFLNNSRQKLAISDPTFLDASVVRDDTTGGLSLGYFTGGAAGGDQRLILEPVDGKYSRTFATCGSAAHMPLMILFDEKNRHGLTMGWDYCGPWAAPVGNTSGDGFHLGIRLDKFSRTLKPGDVLDTPVGFHGVFAGDLDDMGNANLDWQYRYLWKHKKDNFFARPRYSTEFDGPWWLRCGTEDLWSRRLAMDLQFMEWARYVGAGIFWNDAAWYDEFGNWNGPDWSRTHEYVTKHGMEMLVWVWSAVAFPGSRAEREVGPLLTDLRIGPPYLDQSKPEVTEWQLKVLGEKIAMWGNFQWRYDFATALGTDRLAADQEFRRMSKEFVKRYPDCAIDACMGGGNGISYELAEYAQTQQLSDGGVGNYAGYYTSMLLPPDMLYDCFTIIGGQGRKQYDVRSDRIGLRMLPVWIADPGCTEPYQSGGRNGDQHYRPGVPAIRPESISTLESVRKDWDLYRYFVSQGVAGRWSHVFRPAVTGDDPILYFQRMDREGKKGFIVTNRPVEKLDSMPSGAVTVMPKGLIPDLDYDVRCDLSDLAQNRKGSDLMANGITFQKISGGDIIFFNLPNRPGAGSDKEPPSAPSGATKRIATYTFTQGLEVSWSPATDNNWLSCYEVLRTAPDGSETSLGKIASGTFFFDRSALASELAKCRYSVRAIDGDGNVSAKVEAKPADGEPETHYAFGGYGIEQGQRNWSYELAEPGSKYRTLYWMPARGYEGLWADELESCAISRTMMHPHPSGEIARVFTVSKAGTVTLSGLVKKDPTIGVVPSKKCAVRVLVNDRQVWPARGWRSVPPTGGGVSYDVKLQVKPGDRVLHVLRGNPENVSGDIAWNPVIRYE